MNPNDLRIDFESIEWLEWVEIGKARAKTAVIPSGRVRLIEFFPGFEQTNWCERGHIGYLIQGEIETELPEGRKVRFHAGDGIYFPKGSRHRSKNIGTGSALLFLIDEVDRPKSRLKEHAAQAGTPVKEAGQPGDN